MGPLNGLRIIEFPSVGRGPKCAMLLAELSAEVGCIDRIEPNRLGRAMQARFSVNGHGTESDFTYATTQRLVRLE